MTHISDEQLSAFIDGELPEPEMQALRTALAQSVELQQRVAHLQQADRMARLFFTQHDSEPLPSALLDTVRNYQPESNQPLPEAQVLAWPQPRRPRMARVPAWGMAASVLLASILVWQILPPKSDVPAETLRQQALLTLNSGSVQSLDAQTRLELRWSELNSAGEFCRHFVLHTPTGSSAQSACWHENSWHDQPVPEPSAGQYQPASASATLPPSQALNAAEEARWLQQLAHPQP